jgi:hypothetical protein
MPLWSATWTTAPVWAGLAVGDADLVGVFLWFAVVAVASLAGFYLVVALRRWMQRETRVDSFTLQDLRDMRTRGDISDQEFSAMRAAMLARQDLGDARAADDAASAGHSGDPRADEP